MRIGSVLLGGGRKPVVQTMTKTATSDDAATIDQIGQIKAAGGEIVRVAIPTRDDLIPFARIVRLASLPVIADIHFDAYLALEAIQNGAAAVRINPGNFGGREKLRELIRIASGAGAAIRIGVNAGSLEKALLKSPLSQAEKMVSSALQWVDFFQDQGFTNLKLSVKSSDIAETVRAYRLLADKTDFPLHVGLTEAGSGEEAVMKSAVAIGSLLLDGIGDTIRISLTAPPVEEIRIARMLLRLLRLEEGGVELISCPTCGRTSVDLGRIVSDFRKAVSGLHPAKTVRVAIMGCEVNGPGEARDADIGIAFSRGRAFLFRDGRVSGASVSVDEAFRSLLDYIKSK